MAKDPPLEQNWKHWKEKYEMEQRSHERTREEHKVTLLRWQNALSQTVRAFNSLIN